MNLNRKQKAAFKQILIPILAVGVISILHFSFPFYSTVSIKYKRPREETWWHSLTTCMAARAAIHQLSCNPLNSSDLRHITNLT